jgi:hypothetical protein
MLIVGTDSENVGILLRKEVLGERKLELMGVGVCKLRIPTDINTPGHGLLK